MTRNNTPKDDDNFETDKDLIEEAKKEKMRAKRTNYRDYKKLSN